MTITVYKESPVWDVNIPWFMHSAHVLRDLFLDKWDVPEDEEGWPLEPMSKAAEFVRKQYEFPVCLVYANIGS